MENKSFIKKAAGKVKYYFINLFLRNKALAFNTIKGFISIIAVLILYPYIDKYFDDLDRLKDLGNTLEQSINQDEEIIKKLAASNIEEQWCLVKYAYISNDKEISRKYKYEKYNNRFDYTAHVKEYNRNNDTKEYGEYIETAEDGQIVYNGKIKSHTWFDAEIRPFNLVLNYDEDKLLSYINNDKSTAFFKQEDYTMHEKETYNASNGNEHKSFNYTAADGLIRYKQTINNGRTYDKWFYMYPYLEQGIFQPVTVNYLYQGNFYFSLDYRSIIDEVKHNNNTLIFDVKMYKLLFDSYSYGEVLLDSRQRYTYKKCSNIIEKSF